MGVVGNWNLKYDWGCDGGYGSVTWTVNANGTFTSGSDNGRWIQVGGMFILKYSTGGGATYAGNLIGSAMNGAMTTFGGLNGCWYATGPGAAAAAATATTATTAAVAAPEKKQADASGKG